MPGMILENVLWDRNLEMLPGKQALICPGMILEYVFWDRLLEMLPGKQLLVCPGMILEYVLWDRLIKMLSGIIVGVFQSPWTNFQCIHCLMCVWSKLRVSCRILDTSVELHVMSFNRKKCRSTLKI